MKNFLNVCLMSLRWVGSESLISFLDFKSNNSKMVSSWIKTNTLTIFLKRFKSNEGKIAKTSMTTSIKLDKDEKDKCVDSKFYRGMIGSLLCFPLVDLILCLVYIFVLGFNIILRNHIYMSLKEWFISFLV